VGGTGTLATPPSPKVGSRSCGAAYATTVHRRAAALSALARGKRHELRAIVGPSAATLAGGAGPGQAGSSRRVASGARAVGPSRPVRLRPMRRRPAGRRSSPPREAVHVQLPPQRLAAHAELLRGGALAATVPRQRGEDALT